MDVGKQLVFYLKEADKAKEALEKKLGIQISHLEFQIALGNVLGYEEENSTRVVQHEFTADQMLVKLENYEFNFPEEIASIKFDSSILPEGVPIRLDEEEVKHKGEIWVIHKNDKDPFPSNPHGHNKETGLKLHLGNGDLYSSKNKPLNKAISKKYLIAIRNKAKNKTLPTLSV